MNALKASELIDMARREVARQPSPYQSALIAQLGQLENAALLHEGVCGQTITVPLGAVRMANGSRVMVGGACTIESGG